MRRIVAALCAAFVMAGCQDTAPTDPGAVTGARGIASSHAGKYFSFLSPVPPGETAPAGVFHPYAAPILKICRLLDDDCVEVGWTSLDGSTTDALSPVTVSPAGGFYEAAWTGLDQLPRGSYRLTVGAWPLNGQNQEMRILGDIVVNLVSGGGSGLDIADDALPIRFSILAGAFCENSDCHEVGFENDDGGQFILDERDLTGKWGIELQPGFMCGDNQTHCGAGIVVLTIQRYTGPETCIPVPYNNIQWESCVVVRAEPFGVQVTGVTIGQCLEPRADTYASSGHLRLLKVKEDANGAVQPSQVTDLHAEFSGGFIFECTDEFDGVIGGQAAAPGAGALDRLAQGLRAALRPLASLFTPRPVYARGKGPWVASLEDFSRVGPVLPVYAEFDRDNAIGQPGVQLPAAVAPRARVLATRIPGTTNADYVTAGPRGVEHVGVTFTPPGGAGHTIFTDAAGYASAQWVLGAPSGNPQQLLAEVGYPTPVFDPDADAFPNPAAPWASYTFTALAKNPFTAYFLAPLGEKGTGGPNITSVTPVVRVCGPLAEGATHQPEATCNAVATLAAQQGRNGRVWESAWKSDKKTTPAGRLFRIEAVVDGVPVGGVLMRSGGGGGRIEDIEKFQVGSNIPIRFTLEQ